MADIQENVLFIYEIELCFLNSKIIHECILIFAGIRVLGGTVYDMFISNYGGELGRYLQLILVYTLTQKIFPKYR
eukprot:UN19488